MKFSDPIVASGGELVRDQIRSRNYEAGLAGWRIGRDGSAEFNNVTVRGTLTTGAPGAARWEISTAHADTIDGYTGDPLEADPATLTTGIAGGGTARHSYLRLEPADLGTPTPRLELDGERLDALEPSSIRADADLVTIDATVLELSDNSLTVGPAIHFGVVPGAPPAPAFGALLYCQDAGAGKVRLRVKFPTGLAITLATEP